VKREAQWLLLAFHQPLPRQAKLRTNLFGNLKDAIGINSRLSSVNLLARPGRFASVLEYQQGRTDGHRGHASHYGLGRAISQLELLVLSDYLAILIWEPTIGYLVSMRH
jgi:hypothetical protein